MRTATIILPDGYETADAFAKDCGVKLASAPLPWQPIETAPKDGTKIVAYAPEDANGRPRYAVTWWRQAKDDMGYIGWGEFNMTYWPPTHWMPLSIPPR